MANRTKLTPKKREAFIVALRKAPNVTLAADAINMRRAYMYQVKARNPAFAKDWDEAIEEGIDKLEAEVMRRGFYGTDKGIYYQGVLMDTVKEFSDTLAIFLLKAHRPERFRDNYSVEVTGKDGGPVQFENVRDELVGRIDGIAARQKTKGATAKPNGQRR